MLKQTLLRPGVESFLKFANALLKKKAFILFLFLSIDFFLMIFFYWMIFECWLLAKEGGKPRHGRQPGEASGQQLRDCPSPVNFLPSTVLPHLVVSTVGGARVTTAKSNRNGSSSKLPPSHVHSSFVLKAGPRERRNQAPKTFSAGHKMCKHQMSHKMPCKPMRHFRMFGFSWKRHFSNVYVDFLSIPVSKLNLHLSLFNEGAHCSFGAKNSKRCNKVKSRSAALRLRTWPAWCPWICWGCWKGWPGSTPDETPQLQKTMRWAVP